MAFRREILLFCMIILVFMSIGWKFLKDNPYYPGLHWVYLGHISNFLGLNGT